MRRPRGDVAQESRGDETTTERDHQREDDERPEAYPDVHAGIVRCRQSAH